MLSPRLHRPVIAALAAALPLLLWPVAVSAHAALLASVPSDGDVLAAPPAFVHLWFSEPVQAAGRSVVVLAPSGRRVDREPVRDDGTEMHVPLDTRHAPRGTYLVRWGVISTDTHPSSGAFTFSVGRVGSPFARGDVAAGTSATPLGLGLQVAARSLHAVGYALGFGPLAFALLALHPLTRARGTRAGRRLWRLAAAGIALLLLAEPLALLGQTASLGAGNPFDPQVATAALASPFGRALAQRLGAAVLLWALAGVAGEGSTRALSAILVLGLAIAAIDSEASHAAGARLSWPGLGAYTAHVAAMGVWVGGLAALLGVWGAIPPENRGELVARFGRLAAAALAVVAGSGALLALLRLSAPADLVATGYGRTLLIKTLLLGGALPLTFVGARAHRGRARWWGLELAALAGVLTLAGLLMSLPPPR